MEKTDQRIKRRTGGNTSSSRDPPPPTLTSPQSISIRRETTRDDDISEPPLAATPVIVSPRTSSRRKAASAAVGSTPSANLDSIAPSSSAISRQMSIVRPVTVSSSAPSPTPAASATTTSTTPSRRQLAAAAMAARIARGAASASDSELSGGTISGNESSGGGPTHTTASSSSLSSSTAGGSRRNLIRAPSRAVLAPAQASQATAAVPLSKPRVPRQQRAPVGASSPAVRSQQAPQPSTFPPSTPLSAAVRGEKTAVSARPPRAPPIRQQSFPEDQDDVGAADTNGTDSFFDKGHRTTEEEEEEENDEDEEFASSYDVENDDDESVLAIPEKAREPIAPVSSRSSSSSHHQHQQQQQQQQHSIQQQQQQPQKRADPISMSSINSSANLPIPQVQHKHVTSNSAPVHNAHSILPQSSRVYQTNAPVQLYNDIDHDLEDEDVVTEEEEEKEESNRHAYELSNQTNHTYNDVITSTSSADAEHNSTHLIYDDFTDELDSSVNLAHAPATHLASSSVSPCGGQVIYGVASEDVNPLGSATMDFPQSALHLQQQQLLLQQQQQNLQQKQLHRKESKHNHQHPALARLASVRATQGRVKAVEASRYKAGDAGLYNGCESSDDDDDDEVAAATAEEDIDAVYEEDEEEPQDDYSKKALPLPRQHQHQPPQPLPLLAPIVASGGFSGASSDCGSTESSSAQTAEALRRHKSQARLERYGDAVHAGVVRSLSAAPPATSASTAAAAPPPPPPFPPVHSLSSKGGDLTPPRSINVASGVAAALSVGIVSAISATPRATSPPSALRQRHSQPRRTPPSATAINVRDAVSSLALDIDENPTSSISSSSSSSSAAPIAALSFEEFTGNRVSSNAQPDSPPLPVPAPLFNLRVNKRREEYRPSTSLNEDDYDYAIVVRAVVTRKQEAGLAKAKAQADSIAAAARANAALFGVPSVFESTRTPEARSIHTIGGNGDRNHISNSKMVRGTSNLSETGGGFNSSSLRIPTPSGALVTGGASKSSAMRPVAEENDEDNETDVFNDSAYGPAHDSASESDSDSGSASENEASGDGKSTKGKKKGEDEAWYNEWDNEDSDGEEDDEEEEDEDGENRKKKKNENESKSSKHRSRSVDAPSSSSRRKRRGARKSILDTITGIAERGIARVRKSLGGNPPPRSASTPARKTNKAEDVDDSSATSKKSVKFESHKSEAVITVLPRSPDATNNMKQGRAVAFVDKISSPNSFARSALSPSGGLDDDLDDDVQGGGDGDDVGGKVHKCAEILSALRTAGLEAKRVRSLSRRTWLIKIRCSEWRLEIEAEKLRLRMRRRDGGWSKYRRSMRNAFVPAIPDKDDDDSADDDTEVSNPRNDHDNDDDNTTSSKAAKDSKSKKKSRAVPGKERPSLFHSSDRQTLIDHILRSSAREGGAELGTGSPLGAYVTHMFPLHMHTRLNELQSDWLMVWRPERSHGDRDRIGNVDPAWYAEPKLIDVGSLTATAVAAASLQSKTGEGNGISKGSYNSDEVGGGKMVSSSCCSGGVRRCCARSSAVKFCCSTFPVRLIFSVGVAIGKFARSIGRLSSRVLTQPLDRIAAYFGETIAFYFAWLEFYTQWLVVPSIIGVLLFVWQLYYGSLDVAWSPIFSLFMAVWSILFLEFWKRRNAELAQRWGVLHYEDEEVVRPQFIGEWKQDASTGEMVRIYPAWRRAAKYAIVTVPFVLLWVLGILYLMVFVYAVRDQMLYQFEIHEAISRTRVAIMSNATLASFVSEVPEDISIDIHKSIVSAWKGGILQFLRGEARELASELHELDPLSYLARAGLLLDRSNSTMSGSGGGAVHQVSSFVVSAQPSPSPSPLPGLSSGFSLDHLHVDLNKLSSYFQSNDDWRWWLVMVLPPISLGLLMPMIDYLFGALAYKLNEWENHATESHFRNHRIAKVFFFRFSVSFTSLFYYAFSPQQSAMQLSVQLATFLVVGQIWSKFLDVVLPLIWRRVREFKFARRLQHAEDSGLTEGRRGRRLMRHAKQQAWVESRMPQYDSFDDYAQMLMQFGYVTFFSWAFPLAPACALINNLIEMRSDGFKLCHLAQRPLAFKSGGIGVWYNVLVAMSMLAVLTNCAHLALSATNLSGSAAAYFLPDWNLTETQKIFIVFVCEHVVLSLRLVMPYIVPPVPQKVKRRLERDNYALARLQGRRSLGNL